MSNGLVHDKLTQDLQIPVSIISAGAAYITSHDIIYSGLVFITILAGLEIQRFLTPDLDIAERKEYKSGYYGFYLIRRNFGEIPYHLIKWYWWPYSKFTPHRAWWSHGFIIGTLVRVLYFLIQIAVLGYFLGYGPNWLIWGQGSFLLQYLGYFTFGWFLADCGHLFLDYNFSFRGFYESHLGPEYNYHIGHKS